MSDTGVQAAYEAHYQALREALKHSHDAQLELLAVTDRVYAFLEEADAALTDEQVLGLKMLLGESETRLGRYFGM